MKQQWKRLASLGVIAGSQFLGATLVQASPVQGAEENLKIQKTKVTPASIWGYFIHYFAETMPVEIGESAVYVPKTPVARAAFLEHVTQRYIPEGGSPLNLPEEAVGALSQHYGIDFSSFLKTWESSLQGQPLVEEGRLTKKAAVLLYNFLADSVTDAAIPLPARSKESLSVQAPAVLMMAPQTTASHSDITEKLDIISEYEAASRMLQSIGVRTIFLNEGTGKNAEMSVNYPFVRDGGFVIDGQAYYAQTDDDEYVWKSERLADPVSRMYKDLGYAPIAVPYGIQGGDICYHQQTDTIFFGRNIDSEEADAERATLESITEKRVIVVPKTLYSKEGRNIGKWTEGDFYHLDTFFNTLPNGEIVIYPPATSSEFLETLKEMIPENQIVYLTKEMAYDFSANFVKNGPEILMTGHNQSFSNILTERGYNVTMPSEGFDFRFKNAGIRCMVLPIGVPPNKEGTALLKYTLWSSSALLAVAAAYRLKER